MINVLKGMLNLCEIGNDIHCHINDRKMMGMYLLFTKGVHFKIHFLPYLSFMNEILQNEVYLRRNAPILTVIKLHIYE